MPAAAAQDAAQYAPYRFCLEFKGKGQQEAYRRTGGSEHDLAGVGIGYREHDEGEQQVDDMAGPVQGNIALRLKGQRRRGSRDTPERHNRRQIGIGKYAAKRYS